MKMDPGGAYQIVGYPKPAGYWRFYDWRIAQRTKPRLLTRLMARWFFEMEWDDAQEKE